LRKIILTQRRRSTEEIHRKGHQGHEEDLRALRATVLLGTLSVAYTSQVTWGQTKLWITLVLDNTGSMTQKDKNGERKIAALKTAATQLLSLLQSVAQNPGDVMVSVVPFTTGVDVAKSNQNASWLTFVPWDSAGQGDGAYKNALGMNCQPGSPGCNWVTYNPSHSQWSGCVMDRNQDNDVENTAPTNCDVTTLFPAAPPFFTRMRRQTPGISPAPRRCCRRRMFIRKVVIRR
jgi:hypothetical protein